MTVTVTHCSVCGQPGNLGWVWCWTLTPKVSKDLNYAKDCLCSVCREWAIRERMRLLTSDVPVIEKIVRMAASFQEYMAETRDMRMESFATGAARTEDHQPYLEKMFLRNEEFGLPGRSVATIAPLAPYPFR